MCYFRCCSLARLSIVFLGSVLGVFFLSPKAHGQAPNINSLTSDTAIPKPGEGHDSIQMLAESVNPASGSVNVTIAFPTPKGRGISPQYKLLYNSSTVFHLTSSPYGALNFTPSPSIYLGGGWTDNTPVAKWTQSFWQAPGSQTVSTYFNEPSADLEAFESIFPTLSEGYQGNAVCSFASNFTFSDFDGSTHNLNLGEITRDTTFSNPINANCPAPSAGPPEAGDGSVYSAILNSQTLLNYMAVWTSQEGPNWDVVTSGIISPFVVNDAAGNKFTFGNGTPYLDTDYVTEMYATSMEDRNGNEFSWFSDTLNRAILSARPPVGGSGSQSVNIGGIPYTFTNTNSSQTGSFKVPWNGGPTITGESNFFLQCPPLATNFDPVSTSTGELSIGIPSTPETYLNVYWGPYNLISEISYPSGGYVMYTWATPTSGGSAGTNTGQWQLASYAATQVNNVGGTWTSSGATTASGCQYWYAMPALQQRVVSFDGSTIAQTQSFQYSTTWPALGNWTSKQTTVTTTDNKTGTTSTVVYTYAPQIIPPQPNTQGQNDAQVPVEVLEQYYDGAGTSKLVRYVTKSWYTPDLMASEQTTIENGETSTVTYCYSPPVSGETTSGLNCFLNDKQMIQSPSVGIGSVTAAVPLLLEKHEFDYGVNPLAGAKPSRKTVYTYQFFPYPSSPGIAKPEQIITPAGTHIPPPDVLAPQVATEKVYDGKGNLLAETDYGYDEYSTYPLLNITGIQHDDDNYPSTWTVRGNLTSVRKCIAIASNLCGSYAVTTYTYDITGQVLSMTDPLGNPPTHYYYTDSFAGGNQAFSTNAYLTKITDPAGYSEEFSYNYLTGELASSTDENTQQTTYNYESNAILRLTDVVGPASWQNGGAKPDTHYAYVDGPGGSVTITDPVGVKSASYSDGVGHVIETQLETDPNTADTVNTCYTGSGQVYQKTNPYRGTPTTACPITSSVPFTTYYYDALGRPIETVEQDGSTLWSCYNQTPAATPHPVAPAGVCSTQIGSVSTGSWVDSIDEKGNHWQRTSDSFGRLTEVMEPSGTSQAPSMETDYGYDFLNNLLSVNQCGALCTSPASNGPIVRSFQYDSLSRLLSATNPETGRVTYSYDANNNLKTKIDARGVTTSYQYDLLNRVLSKSFSGDVSKTPLSCYQYNASSAACSQANPNWIGRLTNAWTQSASTTSSCSTSASFLTKRSISCYDEMGRITNEQQYTLASQASGVNYLPQYIYDLDGNLTSSTDGVTPNPTTTGSMLTFVNSYDLGRHLQSVTSNWNDASHPPTVFSTNPGSTHPSYTAFGALQSGTFAGISNGITLGRAYDNRMRIMSETDTPSSNQSATPGSATVTILGMEQSH